MVDLKSVTSLKTFIECAEKWRWSYIEKLIPKTEGPSLVFGSWVHTWLEKYYGRKKELDSQQGIVGLSPSQVASQAADELIKEWEQKIVGEGGAEMFRENVAMLLGINLSYHKWAVNHDKDLRILDVEVEGSVNGLYARRDAVVEVLSEPNKGIWVLEHKTHGLGHGYKYEETARFDIQALTCVAVTEGAKGIIYNLIGKPAIRQRQNETAKEFNRRMTEVYESEPDKYYQRRTVPMSGEGILSRIDSSRLALKAYLENGLTKFPQNTSACFAFGRCPFLPLCQGVAEPDDLFGRRK